MKNFALNQNDIYTVEEFQNDFVIQAQTYYIDVYGCQMNVAESQGLSGILEEAGWIKATDKSQADLLIFYTCCIRESAEDRVYGNIGAAKAYKKAKPSMIIALGGCMAQKKETTAKVQKSYSHVDIIFGTAHPYKILDYIAQKEQTKSMVLALSGKRDMDIAMPTLHDSTVSAKVNIMNGCDKFCTFCIVPHVRGREVSRNFDSIVAECEQLLKNEFKEITLIGQNVNSYKYENYNFADLIQTIGDLPYKFRLKFTSPHPQDITQQVIDVVANNPNLAKIIHLPLQAGADRILQKMNRTYTRERFMKIVHDIRTACKDCSISTDIMVGFPTETEEDFLDTLDIVERAKFNNIYSFVYSKRSGTPAARMEGQISPTVKRDRITRLIQSQSLIGNQHALDVVGREYEVLCVAHDGNKALCRTICDRLVLLKHTDIAVGEFGFIKVVESKNSNLVGSLI
ncbi:MAG: tRNA (N6-isopentenyl adenosine(37)-C2)-methylthiotransferase MiaB [Firmicutes bacterium]|nr:tRNA (N6-isopentenyl adenosine(37)-C2)-methylthiotransferase MiaB [Bacillota bacterium]MCL1954081.1 tRNA (N6-isopentenyl adenosine(37)-C2)-methylthiotransferase MiaB [Bacillota bacterium]